MQHLTAKPIRTTNVGARKYVAAGMPFKNSNGQLYGHWVSPSLYVVFSYGPHWPLFIYSTDTRTWYANEDKASRTTSKQYSQAFPYTDHPVLARSCTWMKQAVATGLAFILLSQCEEAQREVA